MPKTPTDALSMSTSLNAGRLRTRSSASASVASIRKRKLDGMLYVGKRVNYLDPQTRHAAPVPYTVRARLQNASTIVPAACAKMMPIVR